MSKCLQCYKTYKEIVLDVTKQTVIMITIRIVRALDVRNVAYEPSGLI